MKAVSPSLDIHRSAARSAADGPVSPGRSHRLLPLLLIVTTLGALGCIWAAWCEFPFYAWNDVRLAPAFALRHGINPYPPLGGGPLFTWIYGPVGIFVNLPATLADTAQTALHVAWGINAVVIIAPLALIFFSSAELRARGATTCALALATAVLLVPRPNLVLQVADHSAIALGLLSCWCLARTRNPSGRWLVAAAACCALAIWSKQITVFLLIAQIGFLVLAGSRAVAMRYVGWVAIFGVAALAGFVALFGFQNLWLNLVAIPGRLPWAEFGPRLTMRPWALVGQILVPGLLLLGVWQKKLWPGRDTESGRFFQIAVLAAAAMLPVGLAGYFKIGGDTNLLHSWDYLLPALLLAWLVRDQAPTPAATWRLLAGVAIALGVRAENLTTLPARPFTRHFEAAAQLARTHPHALWFPQHPVLTFYADGKLWHSEDGVLTRYLADYGLREPDFRRHLPTDLQGVVYPAAVEFPFAMPLLPEFDHTVELPYWKFHTHTPKAVTAP